MKKSYIKYFISLLLFGSNGIVASFIDMNSYEIVFFRAFLGSLLLLLIFLAGKGKFTFFKYKKQFFCLVISGISMGASWMLLYEAYTKIGVSIASLLYYCGPMIVMALSPLVFKEKLTVYKAVGFLTVLCGVFLINGNRIHTQSNDFGVFCGLSAAVMYALMVMFNKKAAGINGLENAMLQLFVSFVTVAVFIAWKQGFTVNITSASVLPIMILGFINTGIGCYFYFSSISHLPVQSVAICGYLEPLSAVLFSAVFLKEVMLTKQVIGGVLILGGAVVGECCKVKHKSCNCKNGMLY